MKPDIAGTPANADLLQAVTETLTQGETLLLSLSDDAYTC